MPEKNRAFSTFLGVDLGGGKGKNTALARLERTDGGVRVVFVDTRDAGGRVFHDSILLDYLAGNKEDALLSVDAPLVPSVCMRCHEGTCPSLEACTKPVVRWFREQGDPLVLRHQNRRSQKPPTTPYTQRACEVLMRARHGILPREALGQGMGPLTARAHYLCRALAGQYQLNKNLIEVYPKATIQVLFGEELARGYKREVNTWRIRADILRRLEPLLRFEVWREGCLKNDHCFDAVICAYTGYLWATQGWTMPEKDREVFEEDGWIFYPGCDPGD